MCLRMVPENPKFRIAIVAAKTRSKGILEHILKHGKSPCFSQVAFQWLVGPDYPLLILPYVDGMENMECAICYGNK